MQWKILICKLENLFSFVCIAYYLGLVLIIFVLTISFIAGHGAIEAIAKGVIYINMKYNPPWTRENTLALRGKPTDYEFTSQHPYLETFPKPLVYTVDPNNETDVREMMEEIQNLSPAEWLQVKIGNLPHIYTATGMLERVFTISNRDRY